VQIEKVPLHSTGLEKTRKAQKSARRKMQSLKTSTMVRLNLKGKHPLMN